MYADSQANRPLICFSICLMGFTLLPEIFVSFELAVEQTAKDGVGDILSCGLINVTMNGTSLILALSMAPLVNKETKKSNTYSFVILMINLILALVFLIIASIYSKK